MIKVFYDGKCGLCSKEISYYQKISPGGTFEWIDITRNKDLALEEGFTYENSLKLLHVKDEKNELKIGVDAFIVIWSALPKFKILAKIATLPIVSWILQKAYIIFADWRFKRIKYCKN